MRVASVGAVILMLYLVLRGLSDVDFDTVRPAQLAFALVGFAVAWIGFALGWSLLLRGNLHRVDVAAWLRTQILRYIPGGVWAPLARAGTFDGSGKRRALVLVAEVVMLIATVAAAGGIFAGFAFAPAWFALCVAPLLCVAGLRAAQRVVGSLWRRAALATCLLLPAWVVYGLACSATQAALPGSPDALDVATAGLLAWLAGFVVVIAPSGAGVRELAYVGLLAGSAPRSQLLAGAALGRILLTAAELLVLGVMAALMMGSRPRVTATGSPGDSDEPGEAARDGHGIEMSA